MEIFYVVMNLVKPGNITKPKKWKWIADPKDKNPVKFYKGYKTEEEAQKEAKDKHEVKQLICD